MAAPLYVVLLHYPVINRHGQEVTTAVTNLDIHDIARTSRTYGAKRYFIVTPIRDQHEMIGRILGHWDKDSSQKEHPHRADALSVVRLVSTFAEVKAAIREETGEDAEVVLTDARKIEGQVSYADFRREWESNTARTRPLAVILGTGWGVSESFYPEVHRILEPVYGPGREEGYNHLSVRAAAAVILDRLFGL